MILAIVFGCLLPSINDLYQVLSSAKGISCLAFLYQATMNIKRDFNFHLVLGYTLYFVSGYVLMRRIKIRKKDLLIGAALFIAGTIIIYTEINFSGSKEKAPLFLQYYQIGVLLQAFGSVICAKSLENSRIIKSLAILAPLTLGIYMVHPLVIETLQIMGIDTMSFDPVLSVPVLALAVFVISTIMSRIILATPLKAIITL